MIAVSAANVADFAEAMAISARAIASARSPILEYVEGTDRNTPNDSRSHLYARNELGDLTPMCDYGWNRSGGDSFSILRGHSSARGTCRTCRSRVTRGLPPVYVSRPHHTRWL